MAVAYQSTQTNTSLSGTTIVVTKPTGTTTNDLLVAQFATPTIGVTITPPSGWTLINNGQGSVNYRSSLYYKLATSSEPANYTWTINSDEKMIATITRITGHNLSSPINTSSVVANNSASTTLTASTITPAANSLILFFGTSSDTSSFSGYTLTTSSPTFTEAYDTNFTNGVSICMAYGVRTASTATGSGTATISGSATSVGQLVAIAQGVDVSTSAPLLSATVTLFFNVLAPLLSITATLLAPVVNKWNNASKSNSAWTNDSKS